MRFPLKTICLFALLGALNLLTSSCAPHTPASSSPSSLNLPAPEANRDGSLVQKQQKLLSQGDYLAALSLADSGKGNSAELLRRALPGAYRQGEQMLAAQHYAEAGAAFAYLLTVVKENEATVTGGEVSGDELAKKRDFCAEQLMVQGMNAYRNGLLEEAIGTWEQILAFAPDHEGAHKSLVTSRTQLTNLQALKKEDI